MISSHEGSRELAALRRRAYGPDADIQSDPAAVRRLHELEELARRTPAAPPSLPDGHSEQEPVAGPPARPASEAVPEIDAAARAPLDPPSGKEPPGHRGWLRRAPVWVIAVASLVIGLVVGGAVVSLANRPVSDPPDQTHALLGDSTDLSVAWISNLASWGVQPSSVTTYQPFDTVDIWVGVTPLGARCLLLSHRDRIFTAACANEGLDPVLDLTIDNAIPVQWDHPMPTGTVVRFIAHDDAVDVWVRSPGSATPSA